jgi:hypothetical protein
MLEDLSNFMKQTEFQLYLVNEKVFRDKMQEAMRETGPAINGVPMSQIRLQPFGGH